MFKSLSRMKRCPKCNLQYDDSLRFCLDDGAELLNIEPAQTATPETLVLPRETPQPTIKQAARPDVPPPQRARPAETADDFSDGTSAFSSGSSGATIGIGILLVLSIIFVFIGVFLEGFVFARRLPTVLLFLSGMILALMRVRRHPRVSLIAASGMWLFLLGELFYLTIAFGINRWSSSATSISLHYLAIYRTVAVISDFVFATVIALLVRAVFVGRKAEGGQTKI